MALNKYVIKRCASADEVRATITKFEVTEGWMPAMDDPELFYNSDPEGCFIGELDGVPISCITLVRYGESFAFVGAYIVVKEHRGKGYGLALWKHALGSLPSSYNMGLDAVLDKIPLYLKCGFKETYRGCRVQIDIAASSDKLQSYTAPSDITIQSAAQVDFDKLSAYDNAAFGAPHHLFLKGLLNGPNTITLAATDTAGEVVGFVASRKTILEEEGWKIAPMYADNGQIARAILKEVLKEMIKDSSQRKVAMFELAYESNPDARALSEELNATKLFYMNRMYTKGPLEFAQKKVYSFNAGELG